jgi:hypothetical protein
MQQTISRPGQKINSPNNKGGNTQSQAIIITTISLFALIGLLAGFTFGALNHPNQASRRPAAVTITPVAAQEASPTPQHETQPRPLGYPEITQYRATQIADGTTIYTFAAHPVDQSIDKGHGKSIQAANITCKIWLTKDDKVTDTLLQNRNRLKEIEALSQSMPKEEANALIFSEDQQTKACNATGDTTWKYQISPSVKKGSYNLVVLTDWLGQTYNWYIVQIIIAKNN